MRCILSKCEQAWWELNIHLNLLQESLKEIVSVCSLKHSEKCRKIFCLQQKCFCESLQHPGFEAFKV